MPNPRQLELRLSAPYHNRTLVADHYLAHLLPDDPRWDEAQRVLAELQTRYVREAEETVVVEGRA
jgi:hypothetical protein